MLHEHEDILEREESKFAHSLPEQLEMYFDEIHWESCRLINYTRDWPVCDDIYVFAQKLDIAHLIHTACTEQKKIEERLLFHYHHFLDVCVLWGLCYWTKTEEDEEDPNSSKSHSATTLLLNERKMFGMVEELDNSNPDFAVLIRGHLNRTQQALENLWVSLNMPNVLSKLVMQYIP